MNRSSWFRKLAAAGAICALLSVAALPKEAKADTPVVVVVVVAAPAAAGGGGISAGAATLGAAAIAAAASIATAVITGASNNSGRGEEAGGDPPPDGGSPDTGRRSRATGSRGGQRGGCTGVLQGTRVAGALGSAQSSKVSKMPNRMRRYLDRSMSMSLAKKTQGARVVYRSAGDVKKAPSRCRFIENKDTVTWDLDLEKNAKADEDYFVFGIESLKLSTTEVPKTEGDSFVKFTAYQGNKVIWRWKARAHQGKRSTHDPLPAGAKISKRTGALELSDFWTTIPVRFSKGKNRTKVRIVMEYAGKGERT